MRDLANQSLLKRKRQTSPKAVRTIIIVILIAGVLYFIASKTNVAGIGGSGDSIVLRDATRGLTPVKVDGTPVEVKNAVNLTSNTATLRNVSGEVASAVATRVFGNGSYTLTVDATLPDPKGSKYEVWLVGGGQTVEAGFMEGAKTAWSLTFRDSDKYSSLKSVWITREITSEDERPEKHVLEGTF